MSRSEDIDERIDYYQALGLTPSATIEELKASYLNLARLHHPDTAPSDGKSSKDLEAEFIKIADAWRILSKPELKSQYDSLRSIYLARTIGFSHGVPAGSHGDSTAISEGFNTQKINYATRVQSRASSNWMDLQDKYKTEKWQNLTLDQRKASRVRPISSPKSSMMKYVVPLVIVGIMGYSMTQRLTNKK